MANEIKITFTDGSLLGEEIVVPLGAPVLIGRSHSADVRLKEADVSGKHIELQWANGGVNAKCLSRHGFQWNGLDIAEGEVQRLSPRDVVTLGSRARFRVDGVSKGGAEESSKPEEGATLATRALTADATAATQFMQSGEETFATRMGDVTLPSDIEMAPRGSMKESPVTDADSVIAVPPPTHVPSSAENTPTIPPDDAPTADDPPPPPVASQPQQDAPADFSIPPEEAPTGTETGLSGEGETQEMKTRQASMDEIFRMKRMLEAKKRFRRKLLTFSLLAFVALLATIVFVSWSRPEENLSQPVADGTDKPDICQYVVKSPSGGIDMVMDYPNDPRMKVSESPDGIDVSTYTGRDRDAPFRLSFTRRSDMRQYHLSLAESAAQEMAALEKNGYVFLADKDDAHFDSESRDGFLFYEQETPQSCQIPVQQGTRFFRREYQREDGSVKWHGVMILLRDRDVVYRLLREVPDDLWPRARSLFLVDPNLALYAGFLRRRWESPGDAALAGITANASLARSVPVLLKRGLTVDWPRVAREIDALVVSAATGSAESRKQADELLKDFRNIRDRLYFELESRYRNARINGSEDEMNAAYQACRDVFEFDSSDLRSRKVCDPKEWPECQRDL